MNLYRTGESGLTPVEPLDAGDTAGLAGALLRGPGGELGAEDVLFVTTATGDSTTTALSIDADGTVVVIGAADGTLSSDTVTGALQSASTAATRKYDTLNDRFEGDGQLQDAHAVYFDREPLPRNAFNDDQRVRLLAPAFDADALDLASFLSDRELAVNPVRVEVFGNPTGDEFLVRFESEREGNTAESGGETAVATDDSGGTGADGSAQWVAGADETRAPDAEPVTPPTEPGSDGSQPEGQPVDDDPAAEEPLELEVLLEAVAEGLQERLAGTFEENTEEMVSVEHGNELLVRPDHPAYAGGVLRYRLRAEADGEVSFEVNIYGGSEAEKEQMRAVIRDNETAIDEELGYEVSDRYGGFSAGRAFAELDQVAASEIIDEFDRLIRFFHPRVMRV